MCIYRSRAHPPSPFDFNFFSLSFPALCLKCLSAPQSLLSSPEIPDPHTTWTVDIPKIAHYDILRDWVEDKLKSWHRLRQPQFGPDHIFQPNGTNGHTQEQSNSDVLHDIEMYKRHLTASYDAWKMITDKKKQETWLHEFAKTFVSELENHKETKSRLDLAEQEIQHLRSQLAQTHHPPEAAMYQPSTLPITRSTTDHLPTADVFNYEGLLSKWKTKIQTSRSIQQPLPPLSPWATATTPTNLNDNHTNGTTYPQQDHNERPSHGGNHRESPSDEDEDLADAPGDEDDIGQHNGMDRGVLDPNLRDTDADGEGTAGGRLLMDLRREIPG